MKDKRYVVLVDGAYLCKGEGCPARTPNIEYAKRFKTAAAARGAITRAKRTHPLIKRKYEVVIVPNQ